MRKRDPILTRYGQQARNRKKRRKVMANITRYAPFGDLFDDFFKGYFVRPMTLEAPETVRRVFVDVTEADAEFKVLAELPGVKKEDIKLEIVGDTVSISAEARAERDVTRSERVVHSERYFGKIARSFRLGQEIDEAKVAAKFTDGVHHALATRH